MPRRWKCTVCGYVHEGEEPPENCPRCGAPRDAFIPLNEEKTNLLRDIRETFVLHPVAAHFPNGLVPTAGLFLLLTLATKNVYFEHTTFFLLHVALAVVPVSMASGIYDWRIRFGGARATIFFKKIVLASTLLLLGIGALILRYKHPSLVTGGGGAKWLYVLLLLAMLPVVGLLGHYGAKLAYQWRNKQM